MCTCVTMSILSRVLLTLDIIGPPHTNIRHNDFTPCIVKPTKTPPPMIDSINCDQLGAHLVETDPEKLMVC